MNDNNFLQPQNTPAAPIPPLNPVQPIQPTPIAQQPAAPQPAPAPVQAPMPTAAQEPVQSPVSAPVQQEQTPEPAQAVQPAQTPTPDQNIQATPQISGISTVVGQSTTHKQVAPSEHAKNINEANAPKVEEPKQTQSIHQNVSQQDIDKYLAKKKKKTIILASIIGGVLLIGSITTAIILLKNKSDRIAKYSAQYRDDYPIVARDENNDDIIINSKGEILSEPFYYIKRLGDNYFKAENASDYKVTILDKKGQVIKENFPYGIQTTADPNVFYDSEHFYDTNFEIIDSYNYKNIENSSSYSDNRDYFVAFYDKSASLIDANQNIKVDFEDFDSTYADIDILHNKFDKKNYCAVAFDAIAYVYNCDSGKQIVKVQGEDDIYVNNFDGGLITFSIDYGKEYKFYDIYNDEIIYEETSDTSFYYAGYENIYGGVFRDKNDKYFNPTNRSFQNDFPQETLISTNKLDVKPEINKNCRIYEVQEESQLASYCNQIYYKNSKVQIPEFDGSEDYDWYLFDETLSNYLAAMGKHYIYGVGDYSYQDDKIFDLDSGKFLEFSYRYEIEYDNDQFMSDNENHFYNIATGEEFTIDEITDKFYDFNIDTNHITYHSDEDYKIFNSKGVKIYEVKIKED